MKTAAAYIATFGRSAYIGVFPAPQDCDSPFERNSPVILQTERGLEVGRIVAASSESTRFSRSLIRRMDDADHRLHADLLRRESEIYAPIQAFLNRLLPKNPLLDIEILFDARTILLHGFWNEGEIQESIVAEFYDEFQLEPLFHDARSELLVEPSAPEEAGCGKTGCGSGGGGCSSCGDGKSGCSTGSCSRGTFKKPDELKDYLLSIREKMESTGRVSLR
jgi:hypothetical protein